MDIEPAETGMSELLAALDDAPRLETQEPAQSDEPAEQAEEQQAEEQPQDEPMADLVDLDGKKLEIPPGTPPQLVQTIQKMAADLKADHTRKTQAAAEDRKQIEAHAQAMQRHQQVMAVTADKWADARAAQQKVDQFKAVDWTALADSDPAQATKLMAMYQTAQAEAQAKISEWQQASQQLNAGLDAQRAQQLSKQWQSAAEAARQALGDKFDAKTDKVALDWVTKKAGTSDARAIQSRFADPVVLEAITKAALWDAAQGKPMQKVAQAPKAIKPAAQPPQRENQSALERLKKTGRSSELINFL